MTDNLTAEHGCDYCGGRCETQLRSIAGPGLTAAIVRLCGALREQPVLHPVEHVDLRMTREPVFDADVRLVCNAYEQQAQEIARLKAALARYGRHDEYCPARTQASTSLGLAPGQGDRGVDLSPVACTCGLAAAPAREQ